MSAPNVIDLRSFGAAAVAARIYRRKHGGRILALIAKTTFGIVPGSVLRWIAPMPIQRDEAHLHNNPIASLTAASDLAFDLPGAELTVSGTAAAPHGAEVTSLDVGFEIVRARTTILTKRLTVVGDRQMDGGHRAFRAMPIVYERALGGLSSPINPVGTDAPNILPTNPSDTHPTGLGPLPCSWTVRRRHRGGLSAKDAYATSEIEVPDDFNVAYFAVAPPDQRLPAFDPGDIVRLIHLHMGYPTLEFALPPLVARGAVEIPGQRRDEIELRLTSIHVEPDQLRATITYRGSVAIGDATTVRAGVGVGMNSIELPPLDEGEAVVDRTDPRPAVLSKEGTHILVPTAIPAVAAQKVEPAVDLTGTVVMNDAASPASLPFAKSAAPPKPKPSDRGAIPGSPWNSAAPKPVVPVTAVSDLSQTIVAPASVRSPRGAAPPPEPEASTKAGSVEVSNAPREDPAPTAPSSPLPTTTEPKKKASVWREDPPEVMKPAPPAPPPVPKADISSLMYRKKR